MLIKFISRLDGSIRGNFCDNFIQMLTVYLVKLIKLKFLKNLEETLNFTNFNFKINLHSMMCLSMFIIKSIFSINLHIK